MPFQLDPRLNADSISIGQFKLCQLLLINDSQYPWFVLVPMKENKTEIHQLSDSDQTQLWLESRLLSIAIMDIFEGQKLNIAAIGNVVSQLHLHHVVRFDNDACWPKPVWGQLPMKVYNSQEIEEIHQNISAKLACFGIYSSQI